MIQETKIVKLRGIPYAVLLDRDDYTANDTVRVRKVKKAADSKDSYYVKVPDGNVDVTDEVLAFEEEQSWRKEYGKVHT